MVTTSAKPVALGGVTEMTTSEVRLIAERIEARLASIAEHEAAIRSDLEALQLRLIDTLRHDHDDKLAQKRQAEALRAADPTRTAKPYYLGDDVVISDTELSPDGRRLLVITTPKGFDAGRTGKLPHYVTESGYEETEDARTRVGRNLPAPQTLWLLDLGTHETVKLAYDGLRIAL